MFLGLVSVPPVFAFDTEIPVVCDCVDIDCVVDLSSGEPPSSVYPPMLYAAVRLWLCPGSVTEAV